MKRMLAMSILALPVFLAGCSHPRPVGYYPPPPPPVANEIARQGYHDGVEAARHDIYQNKAPDPNRHGRFRKPPVPPPGFEDYRHSFQEGYDQVYRHGAPPA